MEQLEMYQTGIVLTMACNLKCRLCSNYAPYYDRPELYSIDFLKEMMRRYFTVVPHIRKLMSLCWSCGSTGTKLALSGLSPTGPSFPMRSCWQQWRGSAAIFTS